METNFWLQKDNFKHWLIGLSVDMFFGVENATFKDLRKIDNFQKEFFNFLNKNNLEIKEKIK